MKGIIIYKGKYGATRQYAEWIGNTLKLPVMLPEEITKEQIDNNDYLVIGTSVYFGKFKIGGWLNENAKLLYNKKLFFFIVNATAPGEQAKRSKFIQDNISGELRQKSEIYFLPGRLIHKDLDWKDKLIINMRGAMLKDPAKKKAIKADLDEVKKENIAPIVKAVNAFNNLKSPPVTRTPNQQVIK